MSVFAERMRGLQMSAETVLSVNDFYVLQLDGRAFHSFTKGFNRPFDVRFMAAMDEVLRLVAEDLGCVVFGFVQSDELSLLLKGSNVVVESGRGNGLPFNGRVQKLASTSAGLASAVMSRAFPAMGFAVFDARVFGVSRREALEWFHWRQTDCVKNSVLSVGQVNFTADELHGVNTVQLQGMLDEVGDSWSGYSDAERFGRVLTRVEFEGVSEFVHKRSGLLERVEYVGSKFVVEGATGWLSDTGVLEAVL